MDSFIKKSSFIYYTENALREAKDPIASIAQAEGLTAHAHSIQIRFWIQDNEKGYLRKKTVLQKRKDA